MEDGADGAGRAQRSFAGGTTMRFGVILATRRREAFIFHRKEPSRDGGVQFECEGRRKR